MLQDTFPWWLGNLTRLMVLILKSNNFHGSITSHASDNSFSYMQILDLSYNNFTGILPEEFFASLQSMKKQDYELYLGTTIDYIYSMTLSVKGVDMEFTSWMFRVFASIDLSRNNIHGNIPESMADLSLLRLLNLSHNRISGSIPEAVGRMTKLEQLDLSSNHLTGGIPQAFTNLTFLSVLNLSHNHLVGPIPPPGVVFDDEEEDSGFMMGFTWKSVTIGYGCGIVLGFIMGYVMAGKICVRGSSNHSDKAQKEENSQGRS